MENSAKATLSPYRWMILASVMLAAFIGSYAQFQLPPVAYKIIPALKLTPSQYASILSAPMLPAVLFSILVGMLADRYGVKSVVTVGLVLAIIGILFRYTATNFWEMFILMTLSGCGSAFLNANISKILGAWFPPEQLGKAMGIYLTSPTLAMFLGMATTALFPSLKVAYITAGIAAIFITIWWVIFAKNKPEGAPDLPVMPVTEYLGVAAKSKGVWIVGVCMMFLMGAAMALSGFLPNALKVVRGIDPVKAGLLGSLGTLGSFFGSIMGPIICDRMGYMKPYLVIVTLLGAIGIYFGWQAPLGAGIWVALLLAGFMGGAPSPILMSFPMLLPEIGPVYAGSAGGLIATLQLIGAFFIPTFVITPLAGNNFFLLFGLAALSNALVAVAALFLPELVAKARIRQQVQVAATCE